nr:MAG TPA: hypothetical protein [Caudoviricetes sp.]
MVSLGLTPRIPAYDVYVFLNIYYHYVTSYNPQNTGVLNERQSRSISG